MKSRITLLTVCFLALVVAQGIVTILLTRAHNAQLKSHTEVHNAQLVAQTERHNAQLTAQAKAFNARLAEYTKPTNAEQDGAGKRDK